MGRYTVDATFTANICEGIAQGAASMFNLYNQSPTRAEETGVVNLNAYCCGEYVGAIIAIGTVAMYPRTMSTILAVSNAVNLLPWRKRPATVGAELSPRGWH